MTQVYLAGGIENVTLAYASQWRDEATGILREHGIDVVNPLDIEQPESFDYGDYDAHKTLVNTEKACIRDSEVLLVNGLGAGWGTAMELMYAYTLTGNQETTIIAFNVPPNPWVMMHIDRVYDSMQDALDDIIKQYGLK